MRVDAVLGKTRGLITVLLSVTLIMVITTVAPAYQDYVFTYSDLAYSTPETTFGDGDVVYVKVTDNKTTGGTKTISVTNEQEGNKIDVGVTEGATTYVYLGSFTIQSGADEALKLHMEHGQTALIEANLDGDQYPGTARITAEYDVITDVIWTYSNSSYTLEETEFGDGDRVYVKITDTQTKGGTKAITVKNNSMGNTISFNVSDGDSDTFYVGSFVVYSGANDDANDKLALFYNQSATITADLAGDLTSGTKIISADYME